LNTALLLDPQSVDARYMLGAISRDQGVAAEAIEQFEKVLAIKPDFENVYGELSQSLLANGQAGRAREVIVRGLALYPGRADFHYLLGNLRAHEGRTDEAIACFRQAVSLQPDNAEAWTRLAVLLQIENRLDEAVDAYDKASALGAGSADMHFNRGNALTLLKRYEEALKSYDSTIRLQPENATAFCNRGRILQGLGRYDEALRSCDRAVELDPDIAEAHFNRGCALNALGRFEDALASYDQAIRLEPANVDAFCNSGVSLCSLRRFAEALIFYDRALQLVPLSADAIGNRGVALAGLGRNEEALACYDRALQLEPLSAETLNNRGALLSDLSRYPEALASFELAGQAQPSHAGAQFNDGMCRLLLGDFSAGWEKYEARWRIPGRTQYRRQFSQPLWSGAQPLDGKTIILHAEQGFGDSIQFVRYARLVAEMGARVLLEVQPALHALFSNVTGVHKVLGKEEPLPAYDYHCPLLSLPRAFHTDSSNIPACAAYLEADMERARLWEGRLGDKTGRRIGLTWSGNASHKNDHNRSIRLAELIGLVRDDMQFVSLQKEFRGEDLPALDKCKSIRRFDDSIGDFADTAALISHMDLVISVDTSVAHLAAAMGKTVWLLLPSNPDWRWLLEREDSPWYPSMRLFRQTQMRNWSDVLLNVRRELDATFQNR
jgi:tetratricopeptide (TPR) repeat protein